MQVEAEGLVMTHLEQEVQEEEEEVIEMGMLVLEQMV